MCCCGKPTINGEVGYRWNKPDGASGVYPLNPPAVAENETILYDEPGRCGGQDSHSYHYRVIRSFSSLTLLVRHGGGDERVYLTYSVAGPLAALDSTSRYWILNAIFHAHSHAASEARDAERNRWSRAVSEKRVKTRRRNGCIEVRIEPKICAKEAICIGSGLDS
jgi:hypothetical protein